MLACISEIPGINPSATRPWARLSIFGDLAQLLPTTRKYSNVHPMCNWALEVYMTPFQYSSKAAQLSGAVWSVSSVKSQGQVPREFGWADPRKQSLSANHHTRLARAWGWVTFGLHMLTINLAVLLKLFAWGVEKHRFLFCTLERCLLAWSYVAKSHPTIHSGSKCVVVVIHTCFVNCPFIKLNIAFNDQIQVRNNLNSVKQWEICVL